jgi:hypothetical protein
MNHLSTIPSFVSAVGRQADRIFLICLILVTSTITAYWPVVTFIFVNYADPDYVTSNSHMLGGLNWRGVVWAFHSSFTYNWHSVTWLSHRLDVEMFGLSAGAAHLVNFLLHTANVLLLFLVLRRLSGGNRTETHYSLAQVFSSWGDWMTRRCNSKMFYLFRRIIPRFIWNWAMCWRGLVNQRKPPLNFVKLCGSRAISRRLNAR